MYGPHTASRFRLQELVGSGGMGQIYRAVDQSSSEIVALKLLKPNAAREEKSRFLREIEVLADLRHPGIVTYLDDGVWPDGRLYLAMEWLEGEDLAKRQRRQPLGMRDSVEVVRRAAQAMAAIHARGVVHRDLKMSNIFLVGGNPTSGVKLIDFGVVQIPEPDEPTTQPGSIIGTPYFMAPEQARGGSVDVRADVYSLGAVLYRLVAGRHVFEADHIIAFLGRLVLEDAPLASSVRFDIPEELDELIARTLSRDPDDRPADAGAFARLLARLPAMGNEPPGSEQSVSSLRELPVKPEPESQAPGARPDVAPGTRERRVIAVVLAELSSGEMPDEVGDKVRAVIGPDASYEALRGGQVVAALGLERTVGDEAVRAARAALVIATTLTEARVAVATGHAVAGRRGLAGEALELAATQLERSDPGGIRVGKATRPLLQGRFVLRGDSQGAVLLHEDIAATDIHRVLGVRTPTLGREEEIQLLLGRFRETMKDASPRAVVVIGSSGVGKSRIRYETMRRLAEDYPNVDALMARGDPMLQRLGLSALGRALRARMGIRDGEPASLQADRVVHYVAQRPNCPPHAAAFLGEFVGVPFSDLHSDALRAAREAPQVMNARILQTLEAIARHDAAAVPQVAVLEDLHLLDETTIQAMGWLLECKDTRIVVFAFGRPDYRDRFAELWPDADVTHVSLTPLSTRMCSKIASMVLPDLDDTTKGSIIDRAQGNALFLEELLRHAAEGRHDLPVSVQALVQARLDKLPPEQRQVVRAASVFGRQCWTDGVSALVGRNCSEDLNALAAAEVVVRQDTSRIEGQTEWAFPQGLVRETAYSTLLVRDRAALHLAASEWLLMAGEHDIGAIARHAEAGGDLGRAAVLYQRAAQQAYANGQLEAALAFATASVACGDDTALRAQALLQQAQILAWLGRYEEQLEAAEAACSFALPGTDLWGESQRLAGSALREQGRAADAEARFSWTLGHPRATLLSAATQARLFAERTRSLIDLGRPQDAQKIASLAVTAAEQAGDAGPNAMLRALDARFMAMAFLGDFSASVDAASAVAEQADTAGDAVLATRARINLGFVLNRVGRFEEARRVLDLALEDGRMLRMRAAEGFALHNIGMSLARMGSVDHAIELQRAAYAIGQEIGHYRLRVSAQIYEAQLLAWRGGPGDLGVALEVIKQARTAASVNPMSQIEATGVFGVVQLARRNFQPAVAACEESLHRLSTVGSMEEGEEIVRLTLVNALLALGRDAEADEALAEAYDCVMGRCKKMSDPSHREAFLTRLEENARIVDLAAERLGKSTDPEEAEIDSH